MLVLFEMTGGFAIFKVLKEHKLLDPSNLAEEFTTPGNANRFLRLKYFQNFETVDDAIENAICIQQSELGSHLRKVLELHITKEGREPLAVLDEKLGRKIYSELKIVCVNGPAIVELSRCIRCNLNHLVGKLATHLKSIQSEVAQGLIHRKLDKNRIELT